ncbi:MAG: hypothetical protein QOI86_2989 [Actinomycetota bacterium]|jgi:nitrite reductase/ring-hydroxylating ferredoxin subunit|nr:hypothetical protein [Actinomycetota bacterium]
MLADRDLRRMAPVLADGTALDELIDDERRTVALRVLTDPQVYELELKRIFARAWVAVAHESEIPNVGDYVTRYIGEDPVIVSRAEDGQIHILLNVCSHRGMQVCRADIGNAKTFRCPYHGWVYNRSGGLLGVPAEKEMYGESLDKSSFGLLEARAGTCAGMVFGSFDEAAPSLDEYLGEIKWYLESAFCRSDGGLEVVGPPQRWTVHANWKLAAEQFAGDGYHALTLHRSMIEMGFFGDTNVDPRSLGLFGVNITTDGHGIRCLDLTEMWKTILGSADGNGDVPRPPAAKFGIMPPPGMTPQLAEQIGRHLSPSQQSLLADFPPVVGNIFPNLGFLNLQLTTTPDGQPGSVITWRIWQPRGAGETEVMSWALVEHDAPPEVKERTRRVAILTFSDSGIFEQDDAEGWTGIQKAVGGVVAQRRTLNYQALTGERRDPSWEGGGLVQRGFSRDDNQWRFWGRWLELLTDGGAHGAD